MGSILRRGTIAEWLERLGYRAESCQGHDFEARLHHPMSVNPVVNGYLFRIREGQGSKRRGMGSTFHWLCPGYSGTLTPTAPMAIRLWEIFTFYLFLKELGNRQGQNHTETAQKLYGNHAISVQLSSGL